MQERAEWDVAVVGGGPAGLSAAHAAAVAGARTLILERAEHPRYKTCGGGLIGASLDAVRDLPELPAKDEIYAATFTLQGTHAFTRRGTQPLLKMVMREEFDAALLNRALAAGAEVWQKTRVRGITDDSVPATGPTAGDGADPGRASGPGQATIRLDDGSSVTASVVIGADGSGGISARHVGVAFSQVDLGLELEIAIPEALQREWRGRLLLDWGKIPASYGWVFPKGDRLTVGVIAARRGTSGEQAGARQGDATREYLREFVERLGLASCVAVRDSGHLTRCRADDSPLRKGRVIVAGDAAGLLEPWTREGISFALRSGALAGQIAARACVADSPAGALDAYAVAIDQGLGAEMRASRVLLNAFTRHTKTFHKGLSTPQGWRLFARICRSELPYPQLIRKPGARVALSVLNRL
ncbi:MAG TPA: geranylgeranyl reductase family protein [Trebonia sp.]|nr:geranylgeranyl reductase family protein [Trebonia sp.]